MHKNLQIGEIFTNSLKLLSENLWIGESMNTEPWIGRGSTVLIVQVIMWNHPYVRAKEMKMKKKKQW